MKGTNAVAINFEVEATFCSASISKAGHSIVKEINASRQRSLLASTAGFLEKRCLGLELLCGFRWWAISAPIQMRFFLLNDRRLQFSSRAAREPAGEFVSLPGSLPPSLPPPRAQCLANGNRGALEAAQTHPYYDC